MKIGLALGSGGARGLAHIAFLKVFDELEIKPDVVAGSSIGSLIGALYCSGLSGKEIENIFLKISLTDLTKMAGYSLKNERKLNSDLVIDYFSKFIKEENIEDLKIPLKIVVSDLSTGKETILSKGPLLKSIKASMSLPIIFNPVCINDKFFIDGGTTNPLPYDILKTDLKIAIDVSRDPSALSVKKKYPFYDAIFNPIFIMQKSIIQKKLEISRPDIYIKTPVDDIKIFEFYRTKEIIKRVEKDAKRFKSRLKKVI